MGFGAIIQGLAAGAGGMAGGISDYKDRQLEERFQDASSQRNLIQDAATAQYRQDSLSQDSARLDFDRQRQADDRDFDADRLAIQRITAQTDSTRAQTAASNAEAASERLRQQPILEAAEARLDRAMNAMDDMSAAREQYRREGKDLSDEEADSISSGWGHKGGFDEVVATLEGNRDKWEPTPRAQGSMRRNAMSSGVLPPDWATMNNAAPSLTPAGGGMPQQPMPQAPQGMAPQAQNDSVTDDMIESLRMRDGM